MSRSAPGISPCHTSSHSTTLGSTPVDRITQALQSTGLWLDVGAAVINVQSRSPYLAAQLQATYPHFDFQSQGDWADVHCRLDPPSGLRRWLKPQVVYSSDAQVIFSPFPADAPLPLFEWGCNWQIGHILNHRLLFHAGALERDGRTLVLPATPGSGKSTLTAALAQRGWRLLSDEFGVLDIERGCFLPLIKPAALKNESIAVIRRFAPGATLGPLFPKTRKGTVAHMAVPADAVARRHESAAPGLVVLPRWQAGQPTQWQRETAHHGFAALAFNAFNYQLIGEPAFHAVVALARRCPVWKLTYSDLDDAIASLDSIWAESLAHDMAKNAA